ncbi:DUF3152 domain-containing protein [Streptomyces huasconensis]|uniref:DUF3152 domain-containing protein n=1 Tax=Streptomyces huasconensis TaxID=1854574 RepID=UPI0033D508B2
MGRHSRRGPAADSEDTNIAGTPQARGAEAGAGGAPSTQPGAHSSAQSSVQSGAQSSAQPGPGTGRRRRATPGDATPAHGTPAHGTPAHGTPRSAEPPADGQVRGGHPEQREPGGGWGEAVGGGAGSGGGAGQGGLPRPPRRRRARSGPRQDYVEAFPEGAPEAAAPEAADPKAAAPEAADPEAAGPDAAGSSAPLPPPPDPYASVTAWNDTPAPRADAAADSDSGAERDAGKGGKGRRARTLTGVAAAAVTVVLAAVVAGQVTGTSDGSDARPQAAPGGGARDTEDPASRSDERPPPPKGPVKGPEAAPVTYEQKMAKKYPLDAELTASGDFEVVPGFDKAPGKGQLFRYRVDVEKGLGLDGPLFAQAVQKTLNDDRSWAHDGGRAFERISSGKPDFVITLASPGTTAAWCAKSGLDTTEDNVSCDSAATERVMINAFRWAQGAKTYGDAVKKKYGSAIFPYRQMLINHEVGHRLGFNHTDCTEDGQLAPVMQQQTKFLNHDGIKCKANPWAYPEG